MGATAGWPSVSEHGNPPEADSLVRPLGQLAVGDRARVVYLVPKHPEQLLRLSNLGLVPGAVVVLLQKRPAAIVLIGETRLAVDPEITDSIYVRALDD